MTVEQALRLTAGSLVGLSLLLGLYHSPYWFGVTGFVALNLIQSGFTNSCPAKWFYSRIGLKPCRKDDPSQSIDSSKA